MTNITNIKTSISLYAIFATTQFEYVVFIFPSELPDVQKIEWYYFENLKQPFLFLYVHHLSHHG